MKKEKIILDCDPGHDDAVAILLAGRNPEIELLAITVVAGNQTLDKTSSNALKICSEVGIKDVPIAAGMGRPLVRESLICPEIHGKSGLDGHDFPEPAIKLDKRHAVDLIIETLMNSDEPVTVVTTGPCTNVAMSIRKEPRILNRVKRFVMMGGSYQLGNITPAAEFNIFADPEAAHIIFTSGRPITMIGLDVTRHALVTPEAVSRIESLDNKASNMFVDLMKFFAKTQKQVFGWENPPLHDPTTIAYLIDPSVVETKPMNVEIELRGEKTYGRTVCDYVGILGKTPNADVGIGLDYNKFWDIIYDTLKLY